MLARVATAAYLQALRAFPRRHRAIYGPEMIDAFERELELRSRERGALAAVGFACAAMLNVIGSGVGERRRYRKTGLTATIGFASLDFILGWRMLLRYPGLSIVSVFGMAVGIGISAGAYTIVAAMMASALPLADDNRVVSLVSWDTVTNNREQRLLRDVASWREMASLQDVAFSRTVQRNLIVDDSVPEIINVAEITPAAFRVAGVGALRGRYLLPEDQQPGAPEAMVIGHEAWLRRFAADPDVVGRQVRLGSTIYSIVGVMPEGFAFPVNHTFWIPSRLDPLAFEPRSGPVVDVFARLAPGATFDGAQAELAGVSKQLATASTATHEFLRPRVVPYTYGFNDMDDAENQLALRAIQILIGLLLLIVCVNVSILVYARTATRQAEIAVRAALGASRRRIVAQLFAESLMLAGVSAALGLSLLSIALTQLDAAIVPLFGRLPFWMDISLSTSTVIYVAVLTPICAAIVGVIPAVKVTGGGVQGSLQGLSPGSGSGMQMGRMWTAMIVAQVALTVALLPAAMFHGWSSLRFRSGDAGYASVEFLTTRVALDRASAPSSPQSEREQRSRYAASLAELERRLRAEAPVKDVTFAMTGVGEERTMVIEVEGKPAPIDPVDYNIVEGTKQGHQAAFNRIAPNFFSAYGVPLDIGRPLTSADTGAAAVDTLQAVVVNRSLVDLVFGGANPLGHRVRYVGRSREATGGHVELNRWYEIVGVVPDFPQLPTTQVSRIYHAVAPAELIPAVIAVRMNRADLRGFPSKLRQLSAAVDPNLQLRNITTAEDEVRREQGMMRLIGVCVILVMFSVVVLSAAGIYALMSVTVSRRRKEIGIRAALGAEPRRILAGIFARALAQLASGAAIGMLLAVGLEGLLEGEMFQGQGAVILPLVAVTMATVGLLAALGPARRGLRIQPTEALRDD